MSTVPYPMQPAVDQWTRHAYMLAALREGYARLAPQPMDDTARLSIACYGPSLKETWQDLQHPILCVSGALKFLVARGIVPDYYVAMDPRMDAVEAITPPIFGVRYLMASCCHPKSWTVLLGHDVILWHAVSHKGITDHWLTKIDPEHPPIQTGSHVGLGAIQVGGLLGYRHFEIHGMDGSCRNGTRHAGPHPSAKQKDDIVWPVHGQQYQTTKVMANGVQEAISAMRLYPIFCVFHGEGLTQALIRKRNYDNACCADEIAKAEAIRMATIEIQPLEVA